MELCIYCVPSCLAVCESVLAGLTCRYSVWRCLDLLWHFQACHCAYWRCFDSKLRQTHLSHFSHVLSHFSPTCPISLFSNTFSFLIKEIEQTMVTLIICANILFSKPKKSNYSNAFRLLINIRNSKCFQAEIRLLIK